VSSTTSTSVISQGALGGTTIELPPTTITQISTQLITTIATSTVQSTFVVPQPAQVFEAACNDPRFLIANLAFYPDAAGGYGSENFNQIASPNECCNMCSSTEGCISWFFDLSPEFNNLAASSNGIPSGVSINMEGNLVGPGISSTSNGVGETNSHATNGETQSGSQSNMSTNPGNQIQNSLTSITASGTGINEESSPATNTIGGSLSVNESQSGGGINQGSSGSIGSSSQTINQSANASQQSGASSANAVTESGNLNIDQTTGGLGNPQIGASSISSSANARSSYSNQCTDRRHICGNFCRDK
jgi:hypothetical protein